MNLGTAVGLPYWEAYSSVNLNAGEASAMLAVWDWFWDAQEL